MTAVRAGITHYAWPGGVAIIFDASTPCAAVFGPGGWRVGSPDTVFSDGPPAGAEVAQLWLSPDVVEQIASQEFAGAGLHTDFVHLERYVARLQAEETNAVVLVLGPGPAALAISGGLISIVEPSAAPSDVVLRQARGWIVVIAGALQEQASPHEVLTPQSAVVGAVPAATPFVEPRVDEAPPAPVLAANGAGPESAQAPPLPALSAPADSAPPQPVLPADTERPEAVFGRFPGEARYLLSQGVAENPPAEVAAELATYAGNGATGTMLHLLDGAHTLVQIAAETGLTPAQVGGMLGTLLAHRLAFKYVSRPRPAAGASAPR